MSEITNTNERYTDWYCEDSISAYLNNLMEIDELLFKLDYGQIANQKELFNFLNFLLTEKFPHECYNKYCGNKLYFSNTFEFARKHLELSLKEFVKLWTTSYDLGKFKAKNVKMFVVVRNSPRARELIEIAGDTPVYVYQGSSIELGHACGKPFGVSVISILDEGKSNIVDMGQ